MGDIESNSILLTIKKLIGYDADYTVFDQDLILFINTRLARLVQLGIGPKEGFKITSAEETWSQFTDDLMYLEPAKEYVYIKCKLVFDPPSNTSLINTLESIADEIEWQLCLDAETEGGDMPDE